mgnify:CR=1 FL=1
MVTQKFRVKAYLPHVLISPKALIEELIDVAEGVPVRVEEAPLSAAHHLLSVSRQVVKHSTITYCKAQADDSHRGAYPR